MRTLLLLLLVAVPAAAMDDGGGRSVFATGAGNRSLAMGGAFCAVADDASAVIYNPAGLGLIARKELQASQTTLFGLGFNEQYASFVLPHWRLGTASLTWRRFGVDGIEGRDERGFLYEMLRADDPFVQQFGQLYLTAVYPGIVKGWHWHKLQTDHFVCVKGMAKVVLYDRREGSPSHGEVNEFFMGERNPILLVIPKGVLHGMKGTGTETEQTVVVASSTASERRSVPFPLSRKASERLITSVPFARAHWMPARTQLSIPAPVWSSTFPFLR